MNLTVIGFYGSIFSSRMNNPIYDIKDSNIFTQNKVVSSYF